MKKTFILLFIAAFCCFGIWSCEKEPEPIIQPEETPTDTIPTDTQSTDTVPVADTVPQPTADFRYNLSASFAVSFTNASTDATSYLWSFGDGSTSTELSPIHAFASIGSKTVTLTAFNGEKSSTKTATFDMTSHIRMMSTSEYPYTVYIDGSEVGHIAGGGSHNFPVAPGNHSVRVLQESGYYFYATDETYNLTCVAGSTVSQEFPEDSWGKNGGKVEK